MKERPNKVKRAPNLMTQSQRFEIKKCIIAEYIYTFVAEQFPSAASLQVFWQVDRWSFQCFF